MKIIIDSNNNQDIEVEEFLEPNFTSYRIRCGDNSIDLDDYQMKELIRKLKPNCFNDLAILIALYRPDAMPAIDGYINGKENPNSIEYIPPDMAQIFDKTYGQNIYQEQSMKTLWYSIRDHLK